MRVYYSEGAWLLTRCSLLMISGERIRLSESRDDLCGYARIMGYKQLREASSKTKKDIIFLEDSRCHVNSKIRERRIAGHDQDGIPYYTRPIKGPEILVSLTQKCSKQQCSSKGVTNRFMYPLWPSRSPRAEKATVMRHAHTYIGTDKRLAAVALNPN